MSTGRLVTLKNLFQEPCIIHFRFFSYNFAKAGVGNPFWHQPFVLTRRRGGGWGGGGEAYTFYKTGRFIFNFFIYYGQILHPNIQRHVIFPNLPRQIFYQKVNVPPPSLRISIGRCLRRKQTKATRNVSHFVCSFFLMRLIIYFFYDTRDKSQTASKRGRDIVQSSLRAS